MPLWLAAVLLPEPGACPRSSAGAQKTEPTAKAFFMPSLLCVQGAAKDIGWRFADFALDFRQERRIMIFEHEHCSS